MSKVSIKTKLLATTLFAGFSSALAGGVALAQDDATIAVPTAADEEASIQERVVVTGSRMQRVDTPVSVTAIGSDYLELRTFDNAIDAIQELPMSGLGTNLEGSTLDNNDFTANANLLNLGTNRTLTLVNGRRFVSSNQATVFVPGNSNGAQVDLSLINPALIERVETVVGSAGASTYGADAVGGVVNLILKDDYEGLDLTAQMGRTDLSDGGTARLSGLWGKNFMDNRANITVGLEWSDIRRVANDDPARPSGNDVHVITSPFAGMTGRNTLRVPGYVNPFASPNGLLVSGPAFAGSATTSFYPNNLPITHPFVQAYGGQPWAVAQSAAGAGIDPMLFVGSFGSPTGGFLQVANTDPATSAALPFRAVPLQFNSNGDLVPFSLGAVTPPNLSDQNSVRGGDGLRAGQYDTLRGAQERFSANIGTRYDLTNNITYKGQYFYANVKSSTVDGVNINSPFGSDTAGNRAIPIYIDDNPYLSAQALATINGLSAQGLTVPTIGGERVMYMSRSLNDLDNGLTQSSENEFFRIVQEVAGDFDFANRGFNWDVGLTWGRVEAQNDQDTVLDIEFALATDVVRDGAGNIVCRQQTLGAPESIGIRNPRLALVNGPVMPTQAQIDACQPLNLMGAGSPSQAAIDYVMSSTASENVSEQFGAAAQFGGDLVRLPAGMAVFSLQGEYRKESNEFIPGATFAGGLGRSTTGQGSQGQMEFLEGGIETNIPILGGDFTVPLVKLLEFDGAYRAVSRTGKSDTTGFESDRVTDYVYRYGGRYQPFDDLTIRASKSTSVRSPSIVELFGAGVTGFTTAFRGTSHPCDIASIDGGPAGGVRRANCEAAVQMLGLPVSFLDTFQSEAGSTAAAGASNPLLNNEESETINYGFVYQPSFIPGLTIQSDYYKLNLDNEVALVSIGGQCFNQPTFPNSIVDGLNACNAVVFGVEDPANPGSYIIPTTNPLTGQPVLPVANPGGPAQSQAPFNSTFSFFDTLNLGGTRLEAINTTIGYNFALESLFGDKAANWGDLNIMGTAYYLKKLDVSGSGTFLDTIDYKGTHSDPELTTLVDVIHSVGPLTHSLQWLRTSSTVTSVTVTNTAVQATDFEQPAFNMFNYNVAYDLTENLRVRFVVNNLFNEFLDEEAFLGSNTLGRGDALGRRYTIALNARF